MLGPKQRTLLVLRDVLGLSGAGVAEALDMSLSDVKVSLHRALGDLFWLAPEKLPRKRLPLSDRT